MMAPEAPPVPDHQGNRGLCSRYAVSKAVGNGFWESKFPPNVRLDFQQDQIVSAIVNKEEASHKFDV